MAPEVLEQFDPVVHGFQLLGVQAVHALPAALVPGPPPDLAQQAQMLGHCRLRKSGSDDQCADGQAAAPRQHLDELPPPRLGDGVEDVGSRGRTWHAHIIFPCGNMSSPRQRFWRRAFSKRGQQPRRKRLVAGWPGGGGLQVMAGGPRRTMSGMSDVGHLLDAAAAGDRQAAADLLPLVYDELRKLAAVRMAAESPAHTLQPTALVHEAYLRLVGGTDQRRWDNRGHFFAAAAQALRRIPVEAPPPQPGPGPRRHPPR